MLRSPLLCTDDPLAANSDLPSTHIDAGALGGEVALPWGPFRHHAIFQGSDKELRVQNSFQKRAQLNPLGLVASPPASLGWWKAMLLNQGSALDNRPCALSTILFAPAVYRPTPLT